MINNFDFFNLPAEKYWDFPKNYKGNKQNDIKNFIFSGDYIGAIKKDGHYYRFVKDGEISFQGRTESVNGGYLNKKGHVPYIINSLNKLPNGTVILGELYFHGGTSSDVTTIMGCKEEKALKRLEEGDKLYYYIFDVWAYDGKSLLDTSAEDRFNLIKEKIKPLFEKDKYIEVADYYMGNDLWELLCWARGNNEEGIVMTKKYSTPDPGKRPAKKTIKVKKELESDIDVFFTGGYKEATKDYTGIEMENWTYWWDIKNDKKLEGHLYEDYLDGRVIEPVTKGWFYGWAGSIEIGCMKDGKVYVIGYLSGVTDEIKRGIVENNDKYKMKPCRVTAMQFTDDLKLRHPKFNGFRDDISYLDCTYDKIFGDE